jgi:hypothetical protein
LSDRLLSSTYPLRRNRKKVFGRLKLRERIWILGWSGMGESAVVGGCSCKTVSFLRPMRNVAASRARPPVESSASRGNLPLVLPRPPRRGVLVQPPFESGTVFHLVNAGVGVRDPMKVVHYPPFVFSGRATTIDIGCMKCSNTIHFYLAQEDNVFVWVTEHPPIAGGCPMRNAVPF